MSADVLALRGLPLDQVPVSIPIPPSSVFDVKPRNSDEYGNWPRPFLPGTDCPEISTSFVAVNARGRADPSPRPSPLPKRRGRRLPPRVGRCTDKSEKLFQKIFVDSPNNVTPTRLGL